MVDDVELLHRYAIDRSEDAIAELVQRHLGVVYGSALRQCGGDHHRAQDVAQAVFTDLARKAGALTRHPLLEGWLYTSTRYAAARVMRAEARRLARERKAVAMNEAVHGSDAAVDPAMLRPVVDDALGALRERDRDAVILRFFEGRAFADIAARFAISEDAARMRVERALERLRSVLARHGITSTAAALGAALSAEAATAVPAGIAAAVTSAAVGGSAGAAAAAGTGFLLMSKVKLAIGLIVIGAGSAGLVWQHRENTRLRADNAMLRTAVTERQRQPPADARPQPANLSRAATTAGGTATATTAHTARAEKPDAAATRTALAPGLVPVETLGNRGRATPRDAFATQLWAARAGETEVEASALMLAPEERSTLQAVIAKLPADVAARYDTPEKLMAFALAGSPHPVGGMEVVGETPEGPDDVILQTRWQHVDDGVVHESNAHLRRDHDGAWKLLVPRILVDRAAAYLTNGR